MSSWLVILKGENSDLEQILNNLNSDHLKVEKLNGIYYLLSSEFALLLDPSDVLSKASELIGIVKSIYEIYFGYFPNIEVAGINRKENDGRIRQFILPIGIASEVRFGSTRVSRSSDPSNSENIIVSKLSKITPNPHARKVARLYGLFDRNWDNLYKIFEAIQSDAGGKITSFGWSTKTELDRFTQTANSEQAIGDSARHGDQRVQPPNNPMSLVEAQLLIKKILEKYIDSI